MVVATTHLSVRTRVFLILAVLASASGVAVLATQGADAATQAVTPCNDCYIGPAQNIEVQPTPAGAGRGRFDIFSHK